MERRKLIRLSNNAASVLYSHAFLGEVLHCSCNTNLLKSWAESYAMMGRSTLPCMLAAYQCLYLRAETAILAKGCGLGLRPKHGKFSRASDAFCKLPPQEKLMSSTIDVTAQPCVAF